MTSEAKKAAVSIAGSVVAALCIAAATGIGNYYVLQSEFGHTSADVAANAGRIDDLRVRVLQLDERQQAHERQREIERRGLERRLGAIDQRLGEIQRDQRALLGLLPRTRGGHR